MTLEERQAENEKLKKRVMEQDTLIRQQSVQIENMLQANLHALRNISVPKAKFPSPDSSAFLRMKSWKLMPE